MEPATSVWIFAALVFVVAGLAKGVIGMGLPTIAMGLLSLVLAPAQAAAVLVVPSLVTNVWQLVAGTNPLGLFRRLWSMMAGVVAGTFAGAGVLAGNNTGFAVLALGVALVFYALVGLAGVKLAVARRHEVWLAPLVGAVTGLVTGATGVFVLPAVPYLQAIGLARDALVQALGLSFTVSTLALAVGLLRLDAYSSVSAGLSLLALAPALIGMWLGQRLRRRLDAATFRRVFFAGLFLLGLYLVLRGIA
jgi:hypothetical protein